MEHLEALRAKLPESAKDIRVNLGAVLVGGGALNADQRYGVALAVAFATGDRELCAALVAAALERASPEAIDDARAATALMAMNNVDYRFRQRVGKPSYSEKPPRLRMSRLASPASSKLDFELFALAVSAFNDCEACVQAHERVVTQAGLSEDHVHEAVRIAAVVAATATARITAVEPLSQSITENP
jgi:alkyl hydroperoxide reductase subunit D